ncbi:hypothetical protein FDP41_011977 [Naegleria fowleri]|uniref:Mitochondrial genome maintenance protein MGM101 n=1 Tax=Naegleria fowleri TaxID=5763 RepID=A0A6A5C317_NAEFO|nr:uncharacterized protein FDP41_011977 [Naegleria fowleri]KAF0982116.1 hypothetical protein FDP41_011977 [Naegleria fowleri]CAG4707980.1 unnamed protein product [Naegleria fowleri]
MRSKLSLLHSASSLLMHHNPSRASTILISKDRASIYHGVRTFGYGNKILRNQVDDPFFEEALQSHESIANISEPPSPSTITSMRTDISGNGSVYSRIGSRPFSPEVASILMAPIPDEDIEVKPDGILYLPEIKYRRILNKAFGPGGWCLIPKSDYKIENGHVIQEFALICHGQFVSQSFGEQTVDTSGYKSIGSSLEGAKSNALMRCCKDIGIASELWDPNFILEWKEKNVVAVFCEHVKTQQTKKLYRRKDREIGYPYVEKKSAFSNKDTTPPVANTVTTADEISELDVSPPSASVVHGEESMFDNFATQDDGPAQYSKQPVAPSSSSQKKGFSFNPTQPIPFGKFKGKLSDDVFHLPDFQSYLSYLEKNNIQPGYVKQLKQYYKK